MKRSFFVGLLLISLQSFAQNISVAKLTCENAESPLGIETAAPSLGWQILSDKRGVQQSAYHVLVADDSSFLQSNKGNIWDSKKIASAQSIQVPFKGSKLLPAKTYYWKVMVWDQQRQASEWSSIASWQMGLPTAKDWKGAKWIGYEEMHDSLRIVPAQENRGAKTLSPLNNTLPLLRKAFQVKKPVKKASLFICGLGHFEASLNGKKIGDHFLDPGWTSYDKEALYVPFDVTAQLKNGSNALGVMLGNGFYFIPRDKRYRKLTGAFGYPKMISLLLIDYTDGTSETITSDESWKTAASPITYTSIYGGEDYNATLEQDGWNTASFNDANWKNVVVVKSVPALKAQLSGSMKVHEIFAPKKTTRLKDDVFVFDLGQNASGIPQITVQGKRGDTVRIFPAELVSENGAANQKATGSQHYYEYILKGSGQETWQPAFTYYGLRYLQVERAVPAGEANLSNLPIIHGIRGLHVRNDAKQFGSFRSSSELFNKTADLIDWAVKSNMASVLTDCPHREKLGWLEQTHLMFESLQYTYGVANYLRKTVADIKAAQTTEGLIPEIAPEYVVFYWGNGMFRDSPEWGSSAVILPWYLYRTYGDKALLQSSYTTMQKYMAYLQTKDSGNILSQGLGDWYDIGPNRPGLPQNTPMGITSTAIYYYDLVLMEKIASLLGKKQDAVRYKKLASEVKVAFNQAFFNSGTKQYGTGSQTANAMALYFNLVPTEHRKAVLENLVNDIRNRNNSITAGDIGFRYLLQTLQKEGRSDVIYDMNSRTDVPGYGYQLAQGATALTESWQALPSVSNNHLMLGHLMEWFYSGLGGIRQADNSIAYKKLEIDPHYVGDLTFVNTSYESSYGIIQSNWKKLANAIELNVTVPANTTARVFLPTNNVAAVQESSRSIKKSTDIKIIGVVNNKLRVQVGSGNYRFVVQTKNASTVLRSK
ncbi:MAG: alpha-L-rhamnosidase [Chitinophagaceae bacterium]|nr:MAG: alpha-L-rhamnosidase [Chitinophagaceae bacterium]